MSIRHPSGPLGAVGGGFASGIGALRWDGHVGDHGAVTLVIVVEEGRCQGMAGPRTGFISVI